MQGSGTNGQLMAFQLMGGDMQAQGHAQMVVNMVDLGANLQASTDMARFHHNQISNELDLESQLAKLVGPKLQAMGHKVLTANGAAVGGYQAILFTPDPQRAETKSVARFAAAGQRRLSRGHRSSQGRPSRGLVGVSRPARRRTKGSSANSAAALTLPPPASTAKINQVGASASAPAQPAGAEASKAHGEDPKPHQDPHELWRRAAADFGKADGEKHTIPLR
jgi:hypothetical protein